MKKELIISVMLHVVVALVLTFGHLPSRTLKDEEILIPMELVSIGDINQSNKPVSAAIKVDEPKPEPPKAPEEAPKQPDNQAQPTPQPPKSEGVVEEKTPEKDDKEEAQKEEPEEEEIIEEEAEEEPEEEVIEEVIPEEKPKEPEKPKEKPKPKEVKPKPKPKAPKKDEKKQKKLKPQDILKNMVENKTKPGAKKEDSKEDETTSSEDTDDLPKGNEMTMTELAAVKQQLARCWKVDVGAKGIGDMQIPLHIKFNRDLSIQSVTVVDQDRVKTDPFYQAAARRAINALHAPECTPLKLPLRKYEQWKDFKVTFDPKQMAGGR